MNGLNRCWYLLLAWGGVGVLYTLSAAVSVFLPAQEVHVLPITTWDARIDFYPIWLAVYASFFVLIPYAFLTAPPAAVKAMRSAFWTCALVSAAVFVCLPTTLDYAALPNAILHHPYWVYLHHFDTAQNCLPSLHASLSTIAVLFALRSASRRKKTVLLLWYALLLWSILACKRHLLVDVGAGVVLGALCFIVFAHRLRIKESSQ